MDRSYLVYPEKIFVHPVHCFMSRKTLTVLITLLFVVLAFAVFSSERGVAGVLEKIGGAISKLFG